MKALFLKHKILFIILILILSIPIFGFNIYWFFVDVVNIGYAYVIDQFLPLVITIIGAFIVTKKYIYLDVIRKYVSVNTIPILIIIATVLIVHGWVLGNYFFGEEPNSILRPVNIGEVKTPLDLRGWHLGMYILSYELFYTRVVFYNILALLLYILTAIILYVFLTQLFNRIKPALIGTLFFITTPAYMDMFSWQFHLLGMPLALSVGLLCLIFLFTYQKNKNFYFYLLSIMFYLSMLKMSFNRLHGFIALPLFMCLFPQLSFFQFNIKSFKKAVLLSLPYFFILLSYIVVVFVFPDHIFIKLFPSLFSGSEYAGADITLARKSISSDSFFAMLSLLFAYLFIPSQFAENYYPGIKEFLKDFPFIPTNISLTFFLGVLIILVLLMLTIFALINIKKRWGQLITFSIIALVANLVFIPFLSQGYGDITKLDQRISLTGSGNGPGIRYVFVSSVGLAFLISIITYWISKHKKFNKVFLAFISVIFIYYSYLNISGHLGSLKEVHPAQSAVPNNIFSMVPNDGKKKILYSVNPESNTIDKNIGAWLYAFYKPEELKYTNSLEEVKNLIASGMYERNNFYAFYNNTHTQTFADVSELAKNKFYDHKANEDVLPLIQKADLYTSLTETKSASFPYVLNRGIYISEDLNYRQLPLRNLSIFVGKRMLPITYPYVDGFVVSKDYYDLFPRSLLDTLNNKPLIFSIKNINLAFSVKILNNRLISDLAYESRLRLAREMISRQRTDKEIVLSNIEKINKHYIDSQEILDNFIASTNFNTLGFFYACAENIDWEKQKISSQAISGIWYTKEIPLNNNLSYEELSDSITCYGSILRKIILIGPPIPSEITVDVILKNDL